MKLIVILLSYFILLTLSACGKTDHGDTDHNAAAQSKADDFYFDFTVDGKSFSIAQDDVSTSYNQFGPNDTDFKIYAGKENDIQLTLIIPQDMSKPSSTPSGSPEAGSKIFQGSVSLQNFPQKGTISNSYDGFANPKLETKNDAIVVTSSDKEAETARIISGSVNASVHDDSNSKDYAVVGKFRIRHEFRGEKF